MGVTDEDVIENRLVSRSIAQAQGRIEGHNFDARKYVLEYDDVMNKHRETMYGLRRQILSASDVRERIVGYLHDQIRAIVLGHVSVETGESDLKEIAEACQALAPFDASLHATLLAKNADTEELIAYLQDEVNQLYAAHEQRMGIEQMRQIEKFVLLRTIDDVWVDHIDAMEHLRESVRLRAYGQRDPLVEYKIESQRMYAMLLETVAARVASIIFKVQVAEQPRQQNVVEARPDVSGDGAIAKLDTEDTHASDETVHTGHVGRNDPCPCGSGKKYKKCGLLNTEEHQRLMAEKK
jgi:preprotein translocase subunit SecA